MRKSICRITAILLSICLLLPMTACSFSGSGFKVNGKIEEGVVNVWYSPEYTAYISRQGMTDNAYLFTDYPDDIHNSNMDSKESFETYLSQKMMTGEGPDMVLAFADELSPKMLAGDMFIDLYKFLDYEDSLHKPFEATDDTSEAESAPGVESQQDLVGVNILQRKDLLMSAVDAFAYNDKLPAMPIRLMVTCYNGNKLYDKQVGLNLLDKTYTIAEFADVVAEAEVKDLKVKLVDSEASNKYYPFHPMPEVYEMFKDFIDYKNGTTRMGEDAVYDYFCAYVKAFNTCYPSEKRYQELLKGLKPEDYMTNSDAYKAYQAFLRDEYIHSVYYKTSPADLSAIDPQGVKNAPKSVQGLLNQIYVEGSYDPGPIPIPSEYGSKVFYIDPSNTVVALIPANSKCPNKAFAYIKAFLSYPYISDFGSGIPLNMAVYNNVKDAWGVSDDIWEKLYKKVSESVYVCNWIGPDLRQWISDLYLNEDGSPKNTIPARAEWGNMKNKIELYLKE